MRAWTVALAAILGGCAAAASKPFPSISLPPASPAVSSAAEEDRLTLSRCLELAAGRAERARSLGEDARQEGLRRDQASARRYPGLFVTGTYFTQEPGGSVDWSGAPLSDDRSDARVSMRWDAASLLRQGPEARRFDKLRDSFEEMRRDALGEAALEAAAAFYTAMLADARVRTARARVERERFAFEEAAERRRQEIAASTVEAERRLAVLRARRELEAAALAADTAWTELRRRIGMEGRPELVDDDEALRSHPAIRAARSRREAAEQELASARLWWVPSLTLQASSFLHRAGMGSDAAWEASAMVEIPLTGMFTAGSEIEIARSRIRQAEGAIVEVEREVRRRVELAHRELASARAMAELAAEAEAAAGLAAAAAEERERLGISTRAEPLECAARREEAALDRLAARAQARLAALALTILAGGM
jgi:outer membrane protein TolC